jgi:hypothetical protein
MRDSSGPDDAPGGDRRDGDFDDRERRGGTERTGQTVDDGETDAESRRPDGADARRADRDDVRRDDVRRDDAGRPLPDDEAEEPREPLEPGSPSAENTLFVLLGVALTILLLVSAFVPTPL